MQQTVSTFCVNLVHMTGNVTEQTEPVSYFVDIASTSLHIYVKTYVRIAGMNFLFAFTALKKAQRPKLITTKTCSSTICKGSWEM